MSQPLVEDIEFLEHFGVKGMRWGVRKEQEKGSFKKSVSEKLKTKTVSKHEKAIEDLDKSIAKADNDIANSKTKYETKRHADRKKFLEEQKRLETKYLEQAKEGRLTDRQKQQLKTAAIVGGVIAAYGIYTMAQSGELNRLKSKGLNFIKDRKTISWKEKPGLSDKNLTIEQISAAVVKPINRGYGAPGTKVNCRRCTFAYEMRRRGYDVVATKTTNSRGQTFMGLLNATRPGEPFLSSSKRFGVLYEAAKENVLRKKQKPVTEVLKNTALAWGEKPIERKNNGSSLARNIFDTISNNEPDGARGELGVSWALGGAHSIAWEKISGKVYLFDGQTGKTIKDHFDFLQTYPELREAGYTRLDDKVLNEDFLQRWLK